MSTLLYLSPEAALWVQVKKQTIVDYIWEPLKIDPAVPYRACRWLNAKLEYVHVLVDCDQIEIDNCSLQKVDSAWQSRSNQRALQKNLIARFPEAIVRTTNRQAKMSSVAVQHVHLPESTQKWMSYVEKSTIVFSSVSTVPDVIAARWSQTDPTEGSIVVNNNSQFIRFTYCRAGLALFTRVISYSSAAEFKNQFVQTLEHLSNSGLVQGAIPAYCIGLLEADPASVHKHELIRKWIDIEPEITLAENADTPNAQDSNAFALLNWLLASNLVHDGYANRHISFGTSKYLNRKKRRRQKFQLVLVVSLFITSAMYTAASERQRINQQRQFNQRKAELIEVISAYRAEAESLTAQSNIVSKALLDKSALESVYGVSPATLLTMLAQAFTQFRELELDELRWVVTDSTNEVQQFESASGDVMNVYARKRIPGTENAPSMTKVMVTGTVIGGDTLRAQHSLLGRFIQYLEEQKGVNELVILNTPLSQFDGSSSINLNQREVRPEFKLQFVISRAERNDAW